MNRDDQPLFAVLEPPPGGAARLRQRLLSDRSSAARWPGAAIAGLAAVATLSVLLFYMPHRGERADAAMLDAPEFDRLLGREPGARPLIVDVNEHNVQAEAVPSSDPRVRIYRLR